MRVHRNTLRDFGGVRLVVIAGLSLALAFSLAAGSARPSDQRSGLIAFTREDGIYVMRTDGSGVRALRRGGVARNVGGLAWSPDGSRLAFVPAQGRAVWTMRADGSFPRRLPSSAGKPGSPTWSPDGQRIAFIAGRDIWVMNADGTNQRRLVETSRFGDEWLSRPVEVNWSPAGGRLVVIGLHAYIANGYVMTTTGTRIRRISRHFDVLEPDWSPDGRRIAFMRWLGPGTEEIYVMRGDGTRRSQLTDNDVPDREPSWSPDGRRIAFVRGDRGSPEIYVLGLDGTGETRLTDDGLPKASPAWQPTAAP